MRLILVRYMGASTNWYPNFALRYSQPHTQLDGKLVVNNAGRVLTFEKFDTLRAYVRDQCPEGTTVEWEGTTF